MLRLGLIKGIAIRVHGVVVSGTERAVGLLGYDEVLNLAREAITHAHQQTVLALVMVATQTVLAAMLGVLGPVESVIKYIMRNRVNKETFEYLGTHWPEWTQFLVDLIEPLKRSAPADSPDGSPSASQAEYNTYSELDLTVP